MLLQKRNQLFIDSIKHWEVDGIDKFEEGITPCAIAGYYQTWTDGSEFKLNGSYCPMCDFVLDMCELCLLEKDSYMCISEYDGFLDNPTIETCQAVIERLWYEAFN